MDFETYAVRKSMSRPIPRFHVELLDAHVRSGMRVLDVGSGDGICLQYVSTLTSKEHLIGTEISQVRVDRVRARGFECVKVDSCVLPFPDASFDVVTFFEVVEHLEHDDARFMLREIARVLVDEGVLIGSTPNYPVKRAYDWSNAVRVMAGRARRLSTPPRAARPAIESGPVDGASAPLGTMAKLATLFGDDPTHVYPLSFGKAARLAHETGYDAGLFQTFKTRLSPTQIGRIGNLFSNKVAFVFRKTARAHA